MALTTGPQDHVPMDLASTYRALYRAQYFASLDASSNVHNLHHSIAGAVDGTGRTARPFLVPLYLLGIYIIPAVYLAIPHTSKSQWWIYVARWPLLAVLTWLHVQMILHVSSPNFASAYAAGLLGAWAVIWNWTVLVWTSPQWDARRVERTRRSQGRDRLREDDGGVEGEATGFACSEDKDSSDVRSRNRNGHANGYGNGYTNDHGNGYTNRHGAKREHNGHAESSGKERQNGHTQAFHASKTVPLENDKDDVEYYWQPFPETASFRTRLNWSFDYVAQFRMTGWNCAIPSLPPYQPPAYEASKQQSLDTLPNRSRDGYTRVTSRKTYIYNTLIFSILPAYILIDLLAILVTNDPYFVAGPEHNHPLPPHLAALNPFTRFLYRQILALFGIISALHLVLNFGHLLICLLCGPVLGFRADPWHLPTITGSFTQVLDRGLAGFWGAWWHQTFRFGFAAPTKWLLKRGYITKGTLIADVVSFGVAFIQSGFVHAAGSYTTVPQSRWWMPPITFLLSGLGMIIQKNLARLGWKLLDKCCCKKYSGTSGSGNGDPSPSRSATPLYIRRLANLLFVLFWLSLTAWPLLDDFGRAGLWLYEPVPVSLFRHPLATKFFRALGLGTEGALGDPLDLRVWRWDREFYPRWYAGRSWVWDTGIGV